MRQKMTEQTYLRIDLATEQLEVALSLFLDKASYAGAITLAGAAEEILGMALKRSGKASMLDWKLEQTNVTYPFLHGKPINRREFIAQENKTRNALKHFNSGDDESITLDLEYSAWWMLVRACENASRLGITVERVDDFNEYFYSSVLGYGEGGHWY